MPCNPSTGEAEAGGSTRVLKDARVEASEAAFAEGTMEAQALGSGPQIKAPPTTIPSSVPPSNVLFGNQASSTFGLDHSRSAVSAAENSQLFAISQVGGGSE